MLSGALYIASKDTIGASFGSLSRSNLYLLFTLTRQSHIGRQSSLSSTICFLNASHELGSKTWISYIFVLLKESGIVDASVFKYNSINSADRTTQQ